MRMKRMLAFGVLIVATAAWAPPAHAGVRIGIGIGLPIFAPYPYYRPYYGYPVYVQPAPVYVQPVPVYAAPPPGAVYLQAAPPANGQVAAPQTAPTAPTLQPTQAPPPPPAYYPSR